MAKDKEEIEIELDDKTLMTLFMMAHEKDITLNQLVEQILREELDRVDAK
jgi:predicted HicB family RNase H-like nuclease